jgi:ribosome hibernation promoting factor
MYALAQTSGEAMTLKVTGKNIDVGEAFQDYAVSKASTILQKYIGPELSGHVRVEKERGRFRTAYSVMLRTGLLVEAQGEAGDAYASADLALVHLEKRVRRYKRRLKDHHQSGNSRPAIPEFTAADCIVQAESDEDDESRSDGASEPIIVAESQRAFRVLAVSEAVMHLELTDDAFLVFRNASHGGINLVYRREDGHIGWIDLEPGTRPAVP